MQFDPQFIPRICSLEKIYTVRSSVHHGEFTMGCLRFRSVIVDFHFFFSFKIFLNSDFLNPVEFGFDTRKEMLNYYGKWFEKKRFKPWSRLYIHRLELVGFK